MAAALAGARLRVVVAGRSAERAAGVAGSPPRAFGVEMDVRDEQSVARAVELVGLGNTIRGFPLGSYAAT
jgi:NAD(P)-dependent dehydrogenase (short-subunit alcohol dehydrogenase family)